MARAEAYLDAKFHLDLSNDTNRLVRVGLHQRHRRTGRQTGRDDNGPIAIERTVLQTVAQKCDFLL